MDLELNGKTALVTGSSDGAGVAIARLLAQEGANVILHGRDRDKAQAVADGIKGPGQTAVVTADLTDDGAMDRFRDEAIAAFGAVDILVNNAGLTTDFIRQRLAEAAEKDGRSTKWADVEEWVLRNELDNPTDRPARPARGRRKPSGVPGQRSRQLHQRRSDHDRRRQRADNMVIGGYRSQAETSRSGMKLCLPDTLRCTWLQLVMLNRSMP